MNALRSSIGKKALMAVSGLVLLGFVIGHLLGNLTIFGGPDLLNAYAHKLDGLKPLVWAMRVVLLAAVAVHSWTSIMVSRENRAARPQAYKMKRTRETTAAAQLMLVTGLLVLAYLVYHLLHFTARVTNPDLSHGLDALGRRDVYAMVVRSFQIPGIAAAYLVGMTAVWFHLMHGIGSAFQTLGLNNERTLAAMRLGSRIIALILYLGYISIPMAVMFGLIK